MKQLPEKPSSFCYLPKDDLRALGQLITSIDEARTQFKDEVIDGFAQARHIKSRPITPVRRNAMESGRVYDEAINRTAKQYLQQADEYLLKKWDTCAVASDYLLDLIAQQEQARKFLAMADAKMPPANATHAHKRAEELSEGARDALDELYVRMQEFVELPILHIHRKQEERLSELSSEMKRFAAEHAEFWKNAADRMGVEGERSIQRFDAHEERAAATLDGVKTMMHVLVENVPDFNEMLTEYRRSISDGYVRS